MNTTSTAKICLIIILAAVTSANTTYAEIVNNTHWKVASGDNLYFIARKIFPDSDKQQARFRKEIITENQQAFKYGASKLKVGTLLKLPAFAIQKEKTVPVKSIKQIAETAPPKATANTTQNIVTPDPEDIIGQIIFKVGQLEASNRSDTRTLSRNENVYKSDTLKTSHNSHTQIRMKDGALISLQPDTVFKFSQYQFAGTEDGNEKMIIELIKGGFRTITGLIGHKNRNNYQVRTSIATIGIRGTHYGLMLCASGSCKADSLEDGLYGGVVDGSIETTNNSGSHIFNNDEYFHITSINNKPALQLIPPPIFKGVKPDKKSKQAESDPQVSAGNFDQQARNYFDEGMQNFLPASITIRDQVLPRLITITDDILEEILTSTPAPNGSGLAISYNRINPAGGFLSTSANFIIGDSTLPSNTVQLEANNTPIAGFMQTAIGASRGFVVNVPSATVSNVGGSATYGINWGRWDGSYAATIDGAVVNHNDQLHYIYSDRLTTPTQLAGLQGSGSISYDNTLNNLGTLPTDHTGATGTASVYMTADFNAGQVSFYSVDMTVGANNYSAGASGIPFSNLSTGFAITDPSVGSCSGGTTCQGEASINFIGPAAEAAITSFSIHSGDNSSSASGTAVLEQGGG